MTEQDRIFIGGGGEGYGEPQTLLLKYANRHGLITGATGTGKTVSLQILAEGFSNAGVPVFCADVKGDLSGLARAGNEKKQEQPGPNGSGAVYIAARLGASGREDHFVEDQVRGVEIADAAKHAHDDRNHTLQKR